MADYAMRYQKVLAQCSRLGIDAFLVSSPINIRYLTGLSLSDGELVITPSENALFVDSRYILEAQQNIFDFDSEIRVFQFKDKFKEIGDWLDHRNFRRIGIESCFLSHYTFLKWQDQIAAQLFPCEDLIEQIRIRKDTVEIQCIQKAIDILGRVVRQIPDLLKASIGSTEREVCLEIDYCMRREGAEKFAFDTILASGERSAMPHAAPTNRRIQAGQVILIDMGAVYEGYHSDLTRVFFLGKRQKEVEDIFRTLHQAQAAAIKQVKPGALAKDIDASARSVIEQAGYGALFGHGTGHGVGLEIHELPRISPTGSEPIEEGMVFTVEPGIYLPNRFGLRLEDVVLVSQQGPQILSQKIPQEITWI